VAAIGHFSHDAFGVHSSRGDGGGRGVVVGDERKRKRKARRWRKMCCEESIWMYLTRLAYVNWFFVLDR
jgi:hypothetical protein